MDHHGQRSSTERNALHEASVWGAGPEVVSLLLEYRADVNLKAKHNGKFKTAHAMAVSKGHEHIAQLIAKASCAPHVKTDLRQEGSTVTSASSAVGQVHRLQTAEPSHARSSSYLAGPMEKRARVDAVRLSLCSALAACVASAMWRPTSAASVAGLWASRRNMSRRRAA